MNTSILTYLLNKPQLIDEKQTMALEIALQQFPYFQSIRALHLKGLFNQNSFRYNYELKKTAAHTNDRSILFDFITSNHFTTLQKNNIEEQSEPIKEFPVLDKDSKKEELLQHQPEVNLTNVDLKKIENTEEVENVEQFLSQTEEKLEIGKPLEFNQNEKHSFQEWLQLTKFSPIERENVEENEILDPEKLKKIDIIDRFIELNPKISPVKTTTPIPSNIKKSIEEPTHLMTETLAKVYLEQKKYLKAIQAYEILILKYPEKSSFFADRINDIKDLQQNNN
ncbi:hypothetical protein LXD69_08705 [Flavobacterium sediminilitoris]|uniref:Tetratricopeptide repeat protein n=1 Tax=Flavobacterium sediminilitoris TaxID=2024526 RepID=A0ABY4HVP0_9FLAO|nr:MULTISPECIES: hypothetical protein [Flavobacterium]UOX35589.1 hypothetical protein LXD69_08705 [Flavobacterium sediminilitoris]